MRIDCPDGIVFRRDGFSLSSDSPEELKTLCKDRLILRSRSLHEKLPDGAVYKDYGGGIRLVVEVLVAMDGMTFFSSPLADPAKTLDIEEFWCWTQAMVNSAGLFAPAFLTEGRQLPTVLPHKKDLEKKFRLYSACGHNGYAVPFLFLWPRWELKDWTFFHPRGGQCYEVYPDPAELPKGLRGFRYDINTLQLKEAVS